MELIKKLFSQLNKIINRLYYANFILVVLILNSCELSNNEIEGYWISLERNILGMDHISIVNDSVTIQDCLGNYKYGHINSEEKIEFRTGGNIDKLDYHLINDSILILEGIKYMLVDLIDEENNNFDFRLLGLDSSVIFPSGSKSNEKWILIKLRDSSREYPLILGDRKGSLVDLLLYAPKTVCSSLRPVQMKYDQVIIQVEKNASVQDLINIEQQLYIEHRIKSFTIITDELSVNSYQSIIDHRYVSNNLEESIFNNMTEYLNINWPPRPIFPSDISFLEEIQNLNVIKVNSFNEFINLDEHDLSSYRHNLFVISTDLKIEEYLSVLNGIQEIRLLKGYKVSTHFLEDI